VSWADQGPPIAQRSGNEEQLKEQIHDCAALQDPKLRTNRCYIIILTVPKQEFQVRITREIFGPMPRGVNEDATLVFNASPLRRGNARTIITTFWVTGVWPPIHRPGVFGAAPSISRKLFGLIYRRSSSQLHGIALNQHLPAQPYHVSTNPTPREVERRYGRHQGRDFGKLRWRGASRSLGPGY